MTRRTAFAAGAILSSVLIGAALAPAAAHAAPPATAPIPAYPFVTPTFGLATAPDGSLLVADAGSGIVELRKGVGSLVAALPNVTDIAPLGRGSMFAITGGGPGATDGKLFAVSRGSTRQIADISGFEAAVNPDGGEIDSNPFDVAALNGGQALVADAGGNSLLIADRNGAVDWVATLPDELVSTANAKSLANCPNPPPDLAFVCDLPAQIPAQAVASSVIVGPDGAYYVGELKGFPGPIGESRIWRIEPGTRHAVCGSDPRCTIVADGFTSIVDLSIGPDGTVYVTEIDEASFLAVELGGGVGGTVNACDSTTWVCAPLATGLTIPIATTVGKDGTVYALVQALIPGAAEVIALT
jgi:hypothetical protein